MKFIVAVDGPSGAGKGTISSYIAERFHLKPIDSGLIYRLGGVFAKNQGMPCENLTEENIDDLCQYIQNIKEEDFQSQNLRLEKIAEAASKIAVNPKIRAAANAWMRHALETLEVHYKGVVVDGRDIGTAVFPKAQVKLFITAEESVRLDRRMFQTKEHQEKIHTILQERDTRDSARKADPLMAANDAYIIDTTHLSLDESCDIAAKYVFNAIG